MVHGVEKFRKVSSSKGADVRFEADSISSLLLKVDAMFETG